jgi:short-subunit dehydrogenase
VHQSGRLRGRVGVITGADSLAGQSMARALAAEGMSLMLVAEPGSNVRDLAEALSEAHQIRCFPAAADIDDRGAVDRLVMHAEQHVGTIDALVNLVPGCMSEALRPTMDQRGHGIILDVDGATVAAAYVVGRCVGALNPAG